MKTMRTNTIPEKVFSHELEAWNHSIKIQNEILRKLDLYKELGHSLDQIWSEICCMLNDIPLYHQAELSVAEGVIKINLEISILNPIEDGVPVYNCAEHAILLSIADFLTKEETDNGCLSYNPAEGF